MAVKEKIHTSMLGRHVLLGKTMTDLNAILASGQSIADKGEALLPLMYQACSGKTGEIVSVYQRDGRIVYDVLVSDVGIVCDGLVMSLNIVRVLPVEGKS